MANTNIVPKYCFICGSTLQMHDKTLFPGWTHGYYQCVNTQCNEVFYQTHNANNDVCLIHIATPFTKSNTETNDKETQNN